MKLTKARLKQIIKEEIAAVRREAKEFDPVMGFDVDVAPAVPEEAEQELNDAVDYFSRDWDGRDNDTGVFKHYYDLYQRTKKYLPADQRRNLDRRVAATLKKIKAGWDDVGRLINGIDRL